MATVSVIVPTFNRLRYLPSAIDSVFAQTFTDWELIVADDGSTDETSAYLRGIEDPRVQTLFLPHSGNPSLVRNAAIRVACGRYLAFLDSDDTWAPEKLEKQIHAHNHRPDRRWSYTGCGRIDEHGRPILDEALQHLVLPEGRILEPLILDPRYQMAMASVVANRDLIADVCGFDARQRWCEDLDLMLRLAMRSQVVVVDEPLCFVRTHGDHYSGDRIAEYESRMRLYGKMSELISEPRLQSLCRRRCAQESLVLAGLRADKGDIRAVWRTLGSAHMFSWRYPDWWFGALKAAARPLVPKFVLHAYRQRRP
jgi:glycosyltransferase involved in cell wall biosynthesis